MKYKILAVVTGLLFAASVLFQTVIAAGAYGPTKENETLWEIASRLRPSDSISVQQMMLALREKNPQAFNANNINSLKKGSYLTLPSQAEIRQYNKMSALQQTRQENRHWQAATGKASLSTAKPAVTLANARKTQARLNAEIKDLRTQLKQEQRHSGELATRIKQLQVAAKVPAPGATATPLPQPEDVKKLQAEVTTLKTQLEEKDTHIQNLQASLREASISIKRQYEESQNLHAQLKAIQPDTTIAAPAPPAPQPGTGSKPGLSLEAAPEKASNPVPVTPPAFTDQVGGSVSTPAPVTEAVPLKQVLEQQANGKAADQAGKLITPSRLSMAVALVSLMFILALLWRSFSQQRLWRKEEERLRASLDEYDAAPGRKDPEILPEQV